MVGFFWGFLFGGGGAGLCGGEGRGGWGVTNVQEYSRLGVIGEVKAQTSGIRSFSQIECAISTPSACFFICEASTGSGVLGANPTQPMSHTRACLRDHAFASLQGLEAI